MAKKIVCIRWIGMWFLPHDVTLWKTKKNGIKAEHWCLAARWKSSAIVFRFWQCFLSGFQFNEHSPKEPTTKRVVHYRRIIKRQLVRQQRLLHSKKKISCSAWFFFHPPHMWSDIWGRVLVMLWTYIKFTF